MADEKACTDGRLRCVARELRRCPCRAVNLARTETEISIALKQTGLIAGDKWQLYAEVKTKHPDLVKPTGRVRFFVNGESVGVISLGISESDRHHRSDLMVTR